MDDIRDLIDASFVSGDGPPTAAATLELLEAIRTEKYKVKATAHPLGFVHAQLAERPDGTQLRLHLWPREPYEPQEPGWFVHRHAWPLRSLIVRGVICDRRYEIEESADGEHRLFSARYEDDQSVLDPVGSPVACRHIGETIAAKGTFYEVPQDAFHASEALASSVTVAESGIPGGAPPFVVGDVAAPSTVYRRRPLSNDELRSLVSELIS